ncbi:hypothetical protein AGOR_G00188520 [Albula goreensis]|uniref:Uncharacterized protein n=1 Tax=Albula goreensis TaxID=1534307 RepID=A0A8T3CTH5_9TELE|nr:hypothetical protein AGOR_G00188520 [Albula goreensis]
MENNSQVEEGLVEPSGQVQTTRRPWLSKVMFCCGFVVGFCLCSVAISMLREISTAQWRQCEVTRGSAPGANHDPGPLVIGQNATPSDSSGRLIYWMGANQKMLHTRGGYVSTTRGRHSHVMLSGSSAPSAALMLSTSEDQEKQHTKTTTAFSILQDRYPLQDGACATVVRLKRADSQFQRLGSYVRQGYVTNGEGCTLSQEAGRRYLEALLRGSSAEEGHMDTCLAGDTRDQKGHRTFHLLWPMTTFSPRGLPPKRLFMFSYCPKNSTECTCP